MKKIGKKLGYFTKVLLVLGLLFSNLSSLSVVFAYEGTDNFTVEVKEDKIVIDYLAEIEDTDVVTAEISENYTYLDNTSEASMSYSQSLTGEELNSDVLVSIDSSMFAKVEFDGLYELSVSLYNETDSEELGTVIYSENVTFDSGLSFSVFNTDTNEEIELVDGVYPVEQFGSVGLVINVLTGGLKPTDVYVVEEEEVYATELVDINFGTTRDFAGLLYGEYTDTISVTVLDSLGEEVVFSSDISYLYSEYVNNANTLNEVASYLEVEDKYYFESEDQDGVLYVLQNGEERYSVNEVIDMMETALEGEEQLITYNISNSETEDLMALYENYLATFDVSTGETPLTREEYFKDTYLDNSTVLTLSNEGLTITFSVLVYGDLNDDGVINSDDLVSLIDQVVGLEETNLEKSDVYTDEVLDTLDVMYLHQVLKNGNWFLELEEVQAVIDARLEVKSEDIVSGDMFTVEYVVSVADYEVNGISGVIDYDKEALRLDSVEVNNEWTGNNNEGKFLYVGNDSLVASEVVDEETGETTVNSVEYVVLTLTFEALKAGESTVQVTTPEFFNQNQYYTAEEEMEVSVVVNVNASSDNTLSSLTVAGQVIELLDDVLSYEITVASDVVSVDVEAITNNIAAEVTSIVAPEELVEGENTITIVVTSEDGNEKIYTITVIREEAPEEEVVTNLNYQEDNNNNTNDEVTTPVKDEDIDDKDDEEEPAEEESNLSKIIIIVLILLVIVGLIYLIFKDDKDDDETKKANKEINKLKKEKEFSEVKKEERLDKDKNKKKSNTGKNNKKGR